ncbi:MAG: GPP34 family phosphoprotein [Acidobacteriales bacterium]|nr:GPP34 family phosphoprotein [Terriglobales bacterium]
MNPLVLNLPEQLLMLAFFEQKANPLNVSLGFGLIGAVLAELLIQGKIDRKGVDLVGRADAGTPDAILNEALILITASEQERSAKYWVNHLNSHLKRLRPRLLDRLVAHGHMTVADQRIMGVFPHRIHRLSDSHTALALKDEIRQVLFRPFAPSARQVALIGLMKPSGLKIFTREERGAARARISEILRSDPISTVSEAVADVAGAAAAIIACSAASA